eukprot:COSAG01_NODE_25348_length_748_cov_0.710324_1_plen_194_part_01
MYTSSRTRALQPCSGHAATARDDAAAAGYVDGWRCRCCRAQYHSLLTSELRSAADLAQELQQCHGTAPWPCGVVTAGLLPALRIAAGLRGVDVHHQPALQRIGPADRGRHVYALLRHRRLCPRVRHVRGVWCGWRRRCSVATRTTSSPPRALGSPTHPQCPTMPVAARVARYCCSPDTPGCAPCVSRVSAFSRR